MQLKKTPDFFQDVCPVLYKFFMMLYQQYIYEYIVSYEYCMLTSLTLIFCLFHSSLNCASLFCNFYDVLHIQLSFWLPFRSMEFKCNVCMHVCICVASKGYSMDITTSTCVNRMSRQLRKNTGKCAWWARGRYGVSASMGRLSLASVWQLLMKFKFHGRNVWPLYWKVVPFLL